LLTDKHSKVHMSLRSVLVDVFRRRPTSKQLVYYVPTYDNININESSKEYSIGESYCINKIAVSFRSIKIYIEVLRLNV
jgi:hypothetical protein